MAHGLTDRQFAEIESAVLTYRNRADRLREKYAQYAGIDIDTYAELDLDDTDPVYDALLSAVASFEQAYELLY